ncbi:myelin-oligodendrocyte glycoprotein-like [Kryptolebias marmoratus]|uniref:myelin-oligodendrocyte glycoprotein-like n=1 Tax=Kryptolebias marmoratus TaxID=37003 RepID=UPI0018ACFEDC|nr:myelin-oligodendrocyte glycoprotein-like [Kryptolebias marmoratus]
MSVQRTELQKVLHASSFWTLIFCLFWTLVQGRYHLIGSSEPIIAAPGDDVILPCRVDPDWDAVEKTVEWSKPDLEVDPSDRQKGVEYVFLYRSQRENRHMMMAAYIERTSLSSEGMKHGDVSLRIRNVTLKDSGRFRCFIPTLRTDAEVRLVVDPDFVSSTASETPVFNRDLIHPEPQNETDVSGRRSRHHIFIVVVILLFFICLSAAFACNMKKFPACDPESGDGSTAWPPCSKAERYEEEISAGSTLLQLPVSSEIQTNNLDAMRPHG